MSATERGAPAKLQELSPAPRKEASEVSSAMGQREDFMASMWFVPVLLWLAVTISCDGSPTIVQKPQSVVESPGGRATLDCFLEGSSNPNFYWYRQMPGGQIEQLVSSVSTDNSENLGPEHIKGERPKDNTFTLKITNLLHSDTGTYYCAWSRTLCQASAAP